MNSLIWRWIGAAVAALAATAFCGPALASQPQPWDVGLQPAASPIMGIIHAFNNGLMIVVGLIVLFVLALLLFVIIRFNARMNPVPSRTSHNTPIEVLWTVVPILILVGIAVPSFSLLAAQHDPARAIEDFDPETSPQMTVKATGSQWFWTYDYPDHQEISFSSFIVRDDLGNPAGNPRLLEVDNELVVPVGTVIYLQVIASDVIHAFAVPSLGVKIDAVPGRLNQTWFLVEREGLYYGQCSELCGRDHAFMPIAVRAVSQEDFDAWVELAAAGDLEGANALFAESAGGARDLEAASVD